MTMFHNSGVELDLNISTLFLLVFVPLFFSWIFSYLFNQKVSELIPVFYSFITVWVYAFSTFNSYELAFKLIIPMLLVAIILIQIFKFKKFFCSLQLKSILSPATLIFLSASIWTFSHSKNMKFYEWDEFSYWGAAAKTIFYFKQIPAISPNQGAFPEYLPGIPLYGSIFATVNGTWSENIIFWAYQVFLISILVSIVAQFGWKQLDKLLLGLFIVVLSSLYFYNSFQTVYADPIMAILFGYCAFLAGSNKILTNRTYFLNLSILLTFLSITKDIAIFFIAVVIGLLAVNTFINSFFTTPKKDLRLRLLTDILLVVSISIPVIISKILWRNVIEKYGLPQNKEFFSFISELSQKSLNIKDIPYLDQLKDNFVYRMTQTPLTEVNGLAISTKNLLIIFIILLLLTVPGRSDLKSQLRQLSIVSTLSLSGIIYLFVIFLAYTNFVPNEALALASYDRYVGAFFAGLIIYLSAIGIEMFAPFDEKQLENRTLIYVILFLLIQSTPSRLIGFINHPNTYSDQIRANYAGQSWLISEMALREGARVWVITQHKVGYEFYLIQYELIPASVGKIPFSLGSPFGPEDIWTDKSYDVNKWSSALMSFDYVFINNSSDSFKDEFSSVFEDPGSLDQLPGFYKVNKNPNSISLTRVR